jgi:phosphohistidine phosphatase
MALYLVQHGKSLPKDVDPEKGLSEEGKLEVRKIAETARSYGIHVSRIIHSGKTRARQTAQIFASELNIGQEIEEGAGLKPLDDVAACAVNIDPEADLMLVGHLPFMEKLTSYLVIGSDEKPIFKFQNGGIVCLEKGPDEKFWIVKWSLSPNIG